MYWMSSEGGWRPATVRPMVTAGFRWQPEIGPIAIRHGQHGEPERERHAEQADAHRRERRRQHGAAAAAQHQPHRAQHFGNDSTVERIHRTVFWQSIPPRPSRALSQSARRKAICSRHAAGQAWRSRRSQSRRRSPPVGAAVRRRRRRVHRALLRRATAVLRRRRSAHRRARVPGAVRITGRAPEIRRHRGRRLPGGAGTDGGRRRASARDETPEPAACGQAFGRRGRAREHVRASTTDCPPSERGAGPLRRGLRRERRRAAQVSGPASGAGRQHAVRRDGRGGDHQLRRRTGGDVAPEAYLCDRAAGLRCSGEHLRSPAD